MILASGFLHRKALGQKLGRRNFLERIDRRKRHVILVDPQIVEGVRSFLHEFDRAIDLPLVIAELDRGDCELDDTFYRGSGVDERYLGDFCRPAENHRGPGGPAKLAHGFLSLEPLRGGFFRFGGITLATDWRGRFFPSGGTVLGTELPAAAAGLSGRITGVNGIVRARFRDQRLEEGETTQMPVVDRRQIPDVARVLRFFLDEVALDAVLTEREIKRSSGQGPEADEEISAGRLLDENMIATQPAGVQIDEPAFRYATTNAPSIGKLFGNAAQCCLAPFWRYRENKL